MIYADGASAVSGTSAKLGVVTALMIPSLEDILYQSLILSKKSLRIYLIWTRELSININNKFGVMLSKLMIQWILSLIDNLRKSK